MKPGTWPLHVFIDTTYYNERASGVMSTRERKSKDDTEYLSLEELANDAGDNTSRAFYIILANGEREKAGGK